MDQNEEMNVDEVLTSVEELIRDYHPAPPGEPEPECVSGDTIRLDQIRKAVAETAERSLEETAVFAAVDTEEHSLEDTAVFAAVGTMEDELEVEPQPVAVVEEPVEPFSEEWEPEYDEPMGDYPNPEPIAFQPKARMKALRAKLVAGPEHQYYALTELGLGKIQLSLILSMLVFVFTVGFTVLYALGAVGPERLRLVVFTQFFGMLLTALLGCYRLLEGVGHIMKLRFTPYSLLVFTFIACCIDSVLCLQELRLSVSCVFCLEMTMAIWGAYDCRNAQIGMMDTLRKASRLDSVVCVPAFYKGKPGICIGQGEVEHFWDYYQRPSTPEKVLNWYALATLLVSLVSGIMGGIRHGFSVGVQICATSLLVGMPATAFLSLQRPLAILEKQLHRLGTVLCGWKGIRAAGSKAAYPLEDKDLFPAGAARLNGMKFYGDRDPDLVLAYTTALIKANRGALVGLFSQLLDSRNGFYYTISELTTHPGGATCEIGDDTVMVGSLEFMQSMGVEMKQSKRMDHAVYTAIDGELCAMFAVAYQKSRSTVAGLRTLCGYRGLTPVVICEDFMLTKNFVQSKFGVNPRRMVFPTGEERREMALREVAEADPVIALTTREGLAPKAFAYTGARVLRSAMKAGVAIHMVGGILGLLAMLALAWVGPQNILSPSTILLYQLIWTIPGFLITEWTRTI